MRSANEPEDFLTGQIIGVAIEVHKFLGPGLLESAYEFFLTRELIKKGMRVERQKPIPVEYDGVKVDIGFRPDLIINNEVIVEVKAVSKIQDIHRAQLLSYLRLAKIERGLLINFHCDPLCTGIKRVSLSQKRGSLNAAE